jgi:hypothetical protein
MECEDVSESSMWETWTTEGAHRTMEQIHIETIPSVRWAIPASDAS